MQNIYVGTRKGLFTIRRGIRGWEIDEPEFYGQTVTSVLPDQRDGRLYAALNHGHFGVKFHRKDTPQSQWQELAPPAYPAAEPVEPEVAAPSVVQVLALEQADPSKPGTLWIGTIPGGLFRSDNHGESWQLMESLWNLPERAKWFGGGYDKPGIHSVCVHPQDAKRIALGVSCAGVWQTQDAGKTWAQTAHGMRAAFMPPELANDPHVQDPHLIVQCRSQPNIFWAQHHNGIFRSTDGGRNWTEITDVQPSVFGFAVATHPTNGDVAWFVPAIKDECRVPVNGAVVVTRTRDGGKTFQTLSKGLPQQHAYDLIYRHGLAIDNTGDVLAMGSTTGSLWISENQGDDWQCVSEHLPPVYCLRFG